MKRQKNVGSAYEFVTIPDLLKRRLAMSNMFLVNSDEDASWVWLGAIKEPAEKVLVPTLQRGTSRSPAFRSYRPAKASNTWPLFYNANHPGKNPDLESQIFLYKDGRELVKGEPQKVDLAGLDQFQQNSDQKEINFRERTCRKGITFCSC